MSQISHYGNESNQRCEIKVMFSKGSSDIKGKEDCHQGEEAF